MHSEIYFWKKGMTCHTSMDVWKDIEKKNKFLKHCFKWGVLISKWMYLYQNAFNGVWGAKCTRKVFSEKRTTLFTHPWMSEKTLKKKINSENTVSNEECLYQNAYAYIKMNAWGMGAWGQNALEKFFLKKRQHFSHIHGCLKRHWKKK